MTRLPNALAGAVLLGAMGSAAAQPVTGVYVGAGAGLNLRHGTTAANGGTRNLNDPGAVGVLALGWGYGNGWRAEIEGSLRGNEVSELRTLRGNGQLVNTGNPTGRAGTAALMLNVLYDLDLARWGIPVRPYLGGGIGYGWRQYYDVTGQEPIGVRGPNGLVTGPGQVRLRGTYGDLAYQAIAGLALPIRAVPGLELTAEYRFFAMDGTKFQESRTLFFPNPSGGGQQSPQFSRRDDNHNHSALLGLRYAFDAPRPAAVAEAAPAAQVQAPTRTYLVFFDWDRADLTDRARQIIGEAATNSRSSRATRIEVSGHADRSGTPAYNQRLSQRRADAVAAELVRRGVGRDEIGVQAFGESRPLVPTADNVREPQNRRVEIVLR